MIRVWRIIRSRGECALLLFCLGRFLLGGWGEEGNIEFGMNSERFGTNLPYFGMNSACFGTNLLYFGINMHLGHSTSEITFKLVGKFNKRVYNTSRISFQSEKD